MLYISMSQKDLNKYDIIKRAMREIAVEPIVAHSPQAKGRIENLFKTRQGRLIKEMRLRNISDIDTANQFLEEEFIA